MLDPPSGAPLVHQTWGKLLFLHWPVPPELLRPFIPEGLEIDTFDGAAWLAVIPFTMWGIRPRFLPALPAVSRAHELNVRTYVYTGGQPGVWFFSLDINSWPGVWAGRAGYSLPYYRADIRLEERDGEISYELRRRGGAVNGTPELEAKWRAEASFGIPRPGSLEFFFTERYCLYAERAGRLYRARVWHRPWNLNRATLLALRSTMLTAQGLPAPDAPPLALYAAEQPTRIWLPERV